MKKWIAMLLALVLCLGLNSTLAEGLQDLNQEELYQLYEDVVHEILRRTNTGEAPASTTEKEILFRNIPYGTDGQTFVETLKESGINGGLKAGKCNSWERNPFDGYLTYKKTMNDAGYVYTASPKGFQVAGYDVSQIEAYFLHGYDDENVYDAKEKSQFYFGRYYMEDVLDKEAAYENLLSKLTGLYGQPQVLTGSDHSGTQTTYCIQAFWYGANDTGLMLYHYYRVSDKTGAVTYSALQLEYGLVHSVERMQDLQAAMMREEIERTTQLDNVDGL